MLSEERGGQQDSPHPKKGTDPAQQIADGSISSRQAVLDCQACYADRNGRVNAITQACFDQALREADQADAARRAGKPLGPLHGVPITIKDCFAVAGMQTTLGIDRFTDGPDPADSPLVMRLKAAGAIIVGKTNVPQGMMLHECDNPRFGRAVLPANPDRSPGGSSGGEAAAVAAGMSVLGLASDLGGSIRQPAHACGVVGFKPTSGRLTITGSRRAMPGLKSLTISPGPITRSVADADLAMRALLDHTSAPRQPDERPEPWPDFRRVDVSNLRIAYWTNDGAAQPAAAVARAVEQSAKRLRESGADVKELAAPDTDQMLRIYIGLITADGMRSMARIVRGKPTTTQIRKQLRLANLHRWLRGPTARLLSLVGLPAVGKLLGWSGGRSADSYWRLTVEADEFRSRFWQSLDRAFGGKQVDVVLNPPHALPAMVHGTAVYQLMLASHCYLANLLDAPAGVVPVGAVNEADQQEELARFEGGWSIEQGLRRKNAQASAGLPVGVQVMARPWQDDLTLAVMHALEPSR